MYPQKTYYFLLGERLCTRCHVRNMHESEAVHAGKHTVIERRRPDLRQKLCTQYHTSTDPAVAQLQSVSKPIVRHSSIV